MQNYKSQAIEKFIDDTCKIAIAHLKNLIELRKITKEKGYLGKHSRFLEKLFHPEEKFYFVGKSKQLTESPNIKFRKEHIVPMTYLLDQLLKMMEEKCKTDEELVKILKRGLGIAHITKEEQEQLDSKYHLKTTMPQGWNLETDDPLQRFKEAGNIEIIKEIPSLT